MIGDNAMFSMVTTPYFLIGDNAMFLWLLPTPNLVIGDNAMFSMVTTPNFVIGDNAMFLWSGYYLLLIW